MTDDTTDMTDTTVIPTTDTNASTPPRKTSRKRMIAIIAIIALIAAGAGGGVALWRHQEHERVTAMELTQAKERCAKAADARRLAQNEWQTLVDGQAATTAKTDKTSVKDTSTLDKLNEELKAKAPTPAACTGDTAAGVDAKTRSLTGETAWYRSHTASLTKAVKAVEASVLDKTVADGQALLASSEGKVADEATRTALKQAVDKRDAAAIGTATGKVQASMKAKQEADEAAARAKAEAEAAAAAAAAQAQAQAQAQARRSTGTTTRRSGQSTTRRQSGTTGNNYRTTTQSNSGTSSSSSGNSSNSSTSSSSGGIPWYLQTGQSNDITGDPMESCAHRLARGDICPVG